VSETVVVGYDGQELSDRALDRAIEAVKAAGGKVIVAVAEELPPVTGYEVGAPLGMYEPTSYDVAPLLSDPHTPMPGVQDIIDRGVKRVRDAGVEAESAWAIGDPVGVILDAAQEHGASTIMVGAHHHGLFGRLSENVSKELQRDAECEVIVVE
jgi:nucleotide-binding universal stress UspA family protein